jgi:MFS family permease
MKPMRSRRVHYAWVVAGAGFTALLASAAFRAVPGMLMVPLQDEFGCSRATISAAVVINLVVFGLFGPFSASLVERVGLRRVVTVASGLIAASAGLTTFITHPWSLYLLRGAVTVLHEAMRTGTFRAPAASFFVCGATTVGLITVHCIRASPRRSVPSAATAPATP